MRQWELSSWKEREREKRERERREKDDDDGCDGLMIKLTFRENQTPDVG